MMIFHSIWIFGLLAQICQGQRTPTISYVTPSITTKIGNCKQTADHTRTLLIHGLLFLWYFSGGTIEMDCSVLYATEYPILWVKLPSHCSVERESYDFRAQEVDSCTPVPLSQGSALIVRDNRFRYNKWLWLPNRVFLPYLDSSVRSQLIFFNSTQVDQVVTFRLDLSRSSTWNRLGKKWPNDIDFR